MVSHTAYSVYRQIMLIFTISADLAKAGLLLFVKAIIQIKLGSSLFAVEIPLPVLEYTIHFEPHDRHVHLFCTALNLLTRWYHGNHLGKRQQN